MEKREKGSGEKKPLFREIFKHLGAGLGRGVSRASRELSLKKKGSLGGWAKAGEVRTEIRNNVS